ncbi:hypothetical protein V5O48_011677 [Marasmius crinis-equi]|uniref:Uncharacterized protein n=1 Tax=Marasmius crinis-equi TaxID=585013 RepID=A0ABR3F4W5_9AGAR
MFKHRRKYRLPGAFPGDSDAVGDLSSEDELRSMPQSGTRVRSTSFQIRRGLIRSSLQRKLRQVRADNQRILNKAVHDMALMREEHREAVEALKRRHSQQLQLGEAEQKIKALDFFEQIRRELEEKCLETERLIPAIQFQQALVEQYKREARTLKHEEAGTRKALESCQVALSAATRSKREAERALEDILAKVAIVQEEMEVFNNRMGRMFAEAQSNQLPCYDR